MIRYCLILVALFSFSELVAQVAPTGFPDAIPLVIGESFTIDSERLGEVRRINVYAPAVYDESAATRLPVLYMPDGGIKEDFLHVAGLVQISSLNGTMRPFLLVGIENTERRRDLTGPTQVDADKTIAPHVGGSAVFRAFIRDELMPAINTAYRTTGETAIVGESLAGLFVVETLLLEPELFDGYVAVDPSLWWNDQQLADDAVPLLLRLPDMQKTLYLATSSQAEISEITGRLATALRERAPEGLVVHHRHLCRRRTTAQFFTRLYWRSFGRCLHRSRS